MERDFGSERGEPEHHADAWPLQQPASSFQPFSSALEMTDETATGCLREHDFAVQRLECGERPPSSNHVVTGNEKGAGSRKMATKMAYRFLKEPEEEEEARCSSPLGCGL